MRYNELLETAPWERLVKEGDPIVCWFSGLHLWTSDYILKNMPTEKWVWKYVPSVEHVIPQTYNNTGKYNNYVFDYKKVVVVAGQHINNIVGNMPIFMKLKYREKVHEYFNGRTEPTKLDADKYGAIFYRTLRDNGVHERSDLSDDWWNNPKLKNLIKREKKAIEYVKSHHE